MQLSFFMGFKTGWLGVISELILWALLELYALVGDYGLSIIILTICIKTLFWPITNKSNQSMKNMQNLVISGAEKLRQNVAEKFRETAGVYPLEAYGATELSPTVSINVPKFVWDIGKKMGKSGSVGHPIPGVKVSGTQWNYATII